MKKILKSKSTYIILAFITFLIYILCNIIAICSYSSVYENKQCDVAIVLGAAASDDGVSQVYKQRLNHVIKLYNDNSIEKIIVTGGKGEGNNFSDAFMAKTYLVSQGILEETVLLEEQSTITQENLQNSKKIMDEEGYKTALVVSDPLHMKRAMLLAKDTGMEDYSVFYDMLSNLENMKYRSSEPKNEADVRKYIEWGIKCAEQKPCVNYRYAVVLKQTGETIGSCELAFTDKDLAELAWELHRNYWRQGYGTEIGNTLLKFGFDVLGLRRIIADCNTLNKGSYGIMEKIGMRREAHYVKYYRGNSALNHEWCDKYLYAILQEDYIKMRE